MDLACTDVGFRKLPSFGTQLWSKTKCSAVYRLDHGSFSPGRWIAHSPAVTSLIGLRRTCQHSMCLHSLIQTSELDTLPHIMLKNTCVKVLTSVGPFLVGSCRSKTDTPAASTELRRFPSSSTETSSTQRQEPQKVIESHRTSFHGFQGFHGDLGQL